MNSRNLAARAGRWSASHRKTAILGWILFVVLATFAGSSIGQKELAAAEMGNGESKRAEMIIDAADFPHTAGEQVLIQGKGSVKAGDPLVTAAVEDTVRRLERIDGVTDIESPLNREDRANTVSKDGRSVVVNFSLPGVEDDADTDALAKQAEAPLAAVAAVQKAHPEVLVEEFGTASTEKALGAKEAADEARSLQLSMSGTLLILLVAFGALVAAGVPLLLGLSSVFATVGLIGPVSQLSGVHPAVAQVVMLVGLAVAVLFLWQFKRAVDVSATSAGRSAEEVALFSPRPADFLTRTNTKLTRMLYPGVVPSALALVGQNTVRDGELQRALRREVLEFLPEVLNFIGMIKSDFPPVGALDFLRRCRRGHAQ